MDKFEIIKQVAEQYEFNGVSPDVSFNLAYEEIDKYEKACSDGIISDYHVQNGKIFPIRNTGITKKEYENYFDNII